jgi:hypothetical protein
MFLSRMLWILTLAAIGTAAVVLPLAPVSAGTMQVSRSIVCLNTVLPTLPTMPRISGLAPVGTVPSTIGIATSATTVPSVMLLIPQYGVYVVPTITTMSSLPGVTFTAVQVLVPPRPAPGQGRPLVVSELIQGATGATVTCY